MVATKRQPSSQRSRFWLYSTTLLIISAFYRFYLHNLVLLAGYGRVIQPVEDFPWDCQRIDHQLLEGCEDIWLDEEGRKLYGSCADIASRRSWSPNGNSYDVSGRSRTDRIVVLDIDRPGSDGLYGLRQLKKAPEFQGDLDLLGFDARRIGNRLRFWLINHKPPVDPTTGEFLDAKAVGANSTVEIFDLDDGGDTLVHVKTIYSEAIISPNSLAVDSNGVGFMVTNDQSTKIGTFRSLGLIFGKGSIAHCQSDTGNCHISAEGLTFPNGIVRGQDGLYYIAHSSTGDVSVHELSGDDLIQVDKIPINMVLDNLSLDAYGNVIVAASPNLFSFVRSVQSPWTQSASTTILSIGKSQDEKPGYKMFKMVEDKEAKHLPTSSVAVHDTQSDRLFLAGVFSPFMTRSMVQEINPASAAVEKDDLVIPLIDFGPFFSGTPSDKHSVALAITDAFKASGFVYLKSHGITPSVVSHVFASSARFFQRPQDQKDSLGWETPESNRGYITMGREKLSTVEVDKVDIEGLRATLPDLKETMEIGREGVDGLPNRWPDELDDEGKDFKKVMLSFSELCKDLHRHVMSAIALGMNLPEHFFDEFIGGGDNTLRLLHYSPVRKDVFKDHPDQVRAAEHTDYGSITLLFQDRHGGLQVRSPRGTFVDATPIADTIVVNAADLLARWSNDTIKSTRHRVIQPPSPAGEDSDSETYPSRYSVAYFCNPDFDKLIEALPGTYGEEIDAVKKYADITAGDYLVQRLGATV
ncbi:hypothetical protein N7495_005143 [Penicillium taxi]|uniref:uncharacterized protein n=1 Tax=Penicillium taxi TaxID=168475 RepID=UPI002545BD20|nr:uncharacterized protein N7495_005143 [Penicillium taxi]KAJ5893452.1 hypothetical protein N7495_005143 [Penicillium taxi]